MQPSELEKALQVGKNYLDALFEQVKVPNKYECREYHKEINQDIKVFGYNGLISHACSHENYKNQMKKFLLS